MNEREVKGEPRKLTVEISDRVKPGDAFGGEPPKVEQKLQWTSVVTKRQSSKEESRDAG